MATSAEPDDAPPPAFPMDEHPEVPCVLFAIPFPKPASCDSKSSNPTFLLYTFPRAVYEKPPVDPVTGKRGKEKLVKKVERKWQEEVRGGEEIKRGEHPDAGKWQKLKGTAAYGASSVIKYLSSNTIETLGRLPPKKKLGQVRIVYPDPNDLPPYFNLPQFSPDQVKQSMLDGLKEAQKKARTRVLVSGAMLPLTLGLDLLIIVPLFLFEINAAYFALQYNGARKAGTLAKPIKQEQQTQTPVELTPDQAEDAMNKIFTFEAASSKTFTSPLEELYRACSRSLPAKFPPVESIPAPSYQVDNNMANELISYFQNSVSSEVASRHLLQEARVAEDLNRILRKATKLYVKAVS